MKKQEYTHMHINIVQLYNIGQHCDKKLLITASTGNKVLL